MLKLIDFSVSTFAHSPGKWIKSHNPGKEESVFRAFVTNFNENRDTVDKLVLCRHIDYSHLPLNGLQLFSLFITEKINLYKVHNPQDKEIDSSLIQMKKVIANFRYEFLTRSGHHEVFILVQSIYDKIKASNCIDMEEFDEQYNLIRKLLTNSLTSDVPLATWYSREAQTGLNTNRIKGEIKFPLNSLYQSTKFAVQEAVQNFVWIKQYLNELQIECAACDTFDYVFPPSERNNFWTLDDYDEILTDIVKHFEQYFANLSFSNEDSLIKFAKQTVEANAYFDEFLGSVQALIVSVKEIVKSGESCMVVGNGAPYKMEHKHLVTRLHFLEKREQLHLYVDLFLYAPILRAAMACTMLKIQKIATSKIDLTSLEKPVYVETSLTGWRPTTPEEQQQILKSLTAKAPQRSAGKRIKGKVKPPAPKPAQPLRVLPEPSISAAAAAAAPASQTLTMKIETPAIVVPVSERLLGYLRTRNEPFAKDAYFLIQDLAQLQIRVEGTVQPAERLNLLSHIVTTASLGIEQLLHFHTSTQNHNLVTLFKEVFVGEPIPALLNKLFLGSVWGFYFYEQEVALNNLTMGHRNRTPVILENLLMLSRNPNGLTQLQYKKMAQDLLSETWSFLETFIPQDRSGLSWQNINVIPTTSNINTIKVSETLALSKATLTRVHNHSVRMYLQESETHLSMLHQTLESLQGCQNPEAFSLNAVRTLSLIHTALDRLLQSVLLHKTGAALPACHDVKILSEMAGLDNSLIPVLFTATKQKIRYPTQTITHDFVGELVENCRTFLFHPDVDQNFILESNKSQMTSTQISEGIMQTLNLTLESYQQILESL